MKAPWDRPIVDTPVWPIDGGVPVVFLVDAHSRVERELLEGWISRHQPVGVRTDTLYIPTSRHGKHTKTDPGLEARLAEHDDPLLVPLRVAWLAQERDGRRRVTPRDILALGDPRDPNLARQRWIRTFAPDRIQIVQGEPAPKSHLQTQWEDPGGRGPAEGTSLADFVSLKALLAMERAERALRGTRYKVPKFIAEVLVRTRGFQQGVAALAETEGVPVETMRQRTGRYLREMAATHSPFVIDAVTGLMGWIISLGYNELDYSSEKLQELYKLGQDHSLVFLPSHKSNADHLVLQYALYENDFPPNHTAGGENLDFLPVGPMIRRSGIFFIRREFKDNEPYKFVLRQYLDHLLEKRFPLEWYLEGGRSRTGKLREPRYGLLAYVVDAYRRGLVDDVVLIPVSIAYDQISDIASYAAEQQGLGKEKEGATWLVRTISGLRHKYGSIYLRFGSPMSLSDTVPQGVDLTSEEGRLVVPKIAFEVSKRINDATPITPVSLVTLALLSQSATGLTLDETMTVLEPFLAYVERRNLPTTVPLSLTTPDEVGSALGALLDNDVLSRIQGPADDVYVIEPDQHLTAAYYRNTIIHFFVNASIVEVAVAGMHRDRSTGVDEFLSRAFAWRALLRFDFFFDSRDEFRDVILEELRLACPEAVSCLEGGDLNIVLASLAPYATPAVLRPFIEAYRLVADVLVRAAPGEELSRSEIQQRALELGRQYEAHGEISTPESLSFALFDAGIALADNSGLLAAETDPSERLAFLADIEDALADIDALAPGQLPK
ncbi:MAG: glycerol-3-phosphate 1-O-acyltransferase [Acidimicrobiia bacterium]|nr:MAG: glycerol-3-phosphate 1-O-acyltransferase [Acidimicrobiia bacterium]